MKSLALILNVVTALFSVLFIYNAYCIIDILLLKSKVKKGKINRIKGLHFNVIRLLIKIKGKLQADNKRKFFRIVNKYCSFAVIIEFICIIVVIVSVALTNVLQSMDNSIVTLSSVINSMFEKDKEDENNKVDSDTTVNSWVPSKDEWRYEDTSEYYEPEQSGTSGGGIQSRPGVAKGPLAVTLDDGSYFWYHQKSTCLTCDYCGDWSKMTWGGPDGDRHLLAEDGCGVYAMAIAISNLKGTAITPKDILLACESTIDESTNDCTTSPKYFYGRDINWNTTPEKVGETFGVEVETVEHTIESIDAILDKGGYVWFWMGSKGKSNWPWLVSDAHFIIIRKHDGENYYCFDECASPANNFKYMNTPVKKEDVISVMKPRRAVGFWVDRQFVSTRQWHSSASGISKYTESYELGDGIKLYNGLPWEPQATTYVSDCEAMLRDMVDYVNTVSYMPIDTNELDIEDVLSKDRMLRTTAGVKSDGSARVQGSNWVSDIRTLYNSEGNAYYKIKSYCTIEGIKCLAVGVPSTVADPTYNMRFADGRWQTHSTPPEEVFGYSTQKLAAVLKSRSDGTIYYLPCSHVDAKAHTFPGGVAQTNVKVYGCNRDEKGTVTSYIIQVSRDWSGTKVEHQLNETWATSIIGEKMNTKLIDHVNNPVSPAYMVDNIGEFWNVGDEVWGKIRGQYQVLGFVVWPNGT